MLILHVMVPSRTVAANTAIVAARPPTVVVDVSRRGEHVRRLRLELHFMAIEERGFIQCGVACCSRVRQDLGWFKGRGCFFVQAATRLGNFLPCQVPSSRCGDVVMNGMYL